MLVAFFTAFALGLGLGCILAVVSSALSSVRQLGDGD